MAKAKTMDIAVLRQLLAYDPDTGALAWRERPREMFVDNRSHAAWNARYADVAAFTAYNCNGYKHGSVLNTQYLAHRVAYAIHYGEWPTNHIDHINGVRDDNRIVNLRSVDDKGNARNAAIPKHNTSGVMGVAWHKKGGKWRSEICVDGKGSHLGLFTNIDDAIAARKAAEVQHGFHENHGRTAHPAG